MPITTDKDKKVYPNTERKNNYRAQKRQQVRKGGSTVFHLLTIKI